MQEPDVFFACGAPQALSAPLPYPASGQPWRAFSAISCFVFLFQNRSHNSARFILHITETLMRAHTKTPCCHP
eukprot:2219335-Prymnesium_polylepis.2